MTLRSRAFLLLALAVSPARAARFIAQGLLERARDHSPHVRRDDVTVVVMVRATD